MRDRRRHEDVAQVTIPMRAVEPYVARAQRVAQVEHDRDFPEAGIIIALRPQLPTTFGMRANEIVGRRNCPLGSHGGSGAFEGASCRERVGQYVYITVVPVSCKKKVVI